MKLLLAALAVAATTYGAGNRIRRPVDPNRTAPLTGQVHPLAQARYDQGLADPATELSYVTLHLRPDPSLPNFLATQGKRWLTPEQFADRFGLSQADIGKITDWLVSQGLRMNDVARGRHWVTFSGSAGQIGRALHTEIHRYLVDGEMHLANSREPSIPEALEDVVAGFRGLDDFKPQSMLVRAPANFTSATPPLHALAPGDIETLYDLAPLYAAGIDGTGQTLVIVGESDLILGDIIVFRIQFGLPVNVPKTVLFGPDPGLNPGPLVEADLDLEWAGTAAPKANLVYVYSSNVFTALQYAVDQNLGTVISASYGSCELYESTTFEAVTQQANAQGITILVASGDAGAANCERGNPTPQASLGPSLSWPASFPEVTAVGGTELDDSSGNYWAARNSSNGGSALSYIPETAWNDSLTFNGPTAGGGGPSVMFTKPGWQTGPGVPNDNARNVPDIALAASPVRYPFIIQTLAQRMYVGGTSASTPVFAGIVALLNQYLVSQGTLPAPGLGNINPALYRLAQAAPTAFHDVTVGNNAVPCVQDSPGCVNGSVGFDAAPGYDLATGLGSVDAYNLVTKWSSGSSTTTTLTATPETATPSSTVQLTATVQASGAGAPTGSVSFVLDGVEVLSELVLGSVNLLGGPATLSVTGSQLSVGNGTIRALYSGDAVFEGSQGSATVTVNAPLSLTSVVVPFVSANPVLEDGEGMWPYTVGLTETAGIATMLTGFSIDGVPQSLVPWATTNIPADGTIVANLTNGGLAAPLTRLFVFTGRDSSGHSWTQQLSVPFLSRSGPIVTPGISLTTATPTVPQNLQADPSCQWSQQLSLQEQGGFLTLLEGLTVNGVSNSQVQSIFGTTRLAPFGLLQGNLCYTGVTAPKAEQVQVVGLSDSGGFLSPIMSVASATLEPPPAAPVAFSSPAAGATVNLDAATALVIPVSFSGGSTPWTVSVGPANSATSWLSVSPKSGSGAGFVTAVATASGLSPGAYTAVLSFAASDAQPQVINMLVTLTVSAAPITAPISMTIRGVENNFSAGKTVAPGAVVGVYGYLLGPAGASFIAGGLPLPLTLGGVSATVNGVAAPLYYVSTNQINLQIPYETGAGTAVLAINNNGQVATFPLTVAVTAPGVCNCVVDNATGNVVQSATPGQVLQLYMTGEGDVTPTLATGATPPLNTNPAKYPVPRLPVAVTIGGVPALLLFQGIPNGLAGVTQIDLAVPSTAPTGPQQVIVTVGGVAAPPVNLTIGNGP